MEPSPTLTILTPQSPLIAYPPYNVSITPFAIVIFWNEITDFYLKGNDLIQYYRLEWDQGTGNWTEITKRSDGFALSFIHTMVGNTFPNDTY